VRSVGLILTSVQLCRAIGHEIQKAKILCSRNSQKAKAVSRETITVQLYRHIKLVKTIAIITRKPS